MKKFEIKNMGQEKWLLLHNEFPKFTCTFENKKFNISRSIKGLSDPMGDPTEVKLLQRMDDWLMKNHNDKV